MSRSKSKYLFKFLHSHVRLLVLIAIIGSVVSTILVIHASPTTTPQTSPLSSIPTTNAINPANTSQTANWQSVTRGRKSLDFTVKYPSDWDQPFDHCITTPPATALNLAPGCIKIVVFTETLPQEGQLGNVERLKLLSQGKTTINGYQVLRNVFSATSANVPATYQAWFYDKDKPFMAILVYIGTGTDAQTANDYINKLDEMIGSIQFKRH